MDPPLASDPAPQPLPPVSAETTAAVDSVNSASYAPPPNHPPYSEMIAAAISGLNEPNGSSKQAIARYIESQYTNLPATHAALLTHHLKTLKLNGQLVMDKHSYKLPARSATGGPVAPPPTDVAVNAANPSEPAPKRRPGRPPKPKGVDNDLNIQHAVPVFAQPADALNLALPQNAEPVVPDSAPVASGPEGTVNGQKRGRGRPRKVGGVARGPSRPPKSSGAGRGRPRGRPPKVVNVDGATPAAAAAAPVAGKKRRGRQPKSASAGGVGNLRVMTKPRKLSGKPLGRPRKTPRVTPAGGTPDSQLLVAYLDLKTKYENLQARIRQTATLIRPCLNNEAALSTLNELEMAGMMNPYAPPPPAPQTHPMAQPQFVQTQVQAPPES